MSDWLISAPSGATALPGLALAGRVAAALLLGGGVAALYRWARRGETISATFVPTLVLLAAVIALATQIIGDNVARAFSLVGALSVVRFRTVVKDTQDTAFVIFAVVAGMAAGAGRLEVGLVGLLVIAVASLVLWPPGRPGRRELTGTLSMRIGLADGIRDAAEALISAATRHHDLTSVGTARQGSALDLTYRIRLVPGGSPTALVTSLNRLEGVESVELSREE